MDAPFIRNHLSPINLLIMEAAGGCYEYFIIFVCSIPGICNSKFALIYRITKTIYLFVLISDVQVN